MSKIFNLTEEQLSFISFIEREVAAHPCLDKRLKSCLDHIAYKDDNKTSEKTLCHSPHKMIEFLSLFSRDDRFKWYTHKWDMSNPFNIEEFIKRQRIYKKELSAMAYPEESGSAVNECTYNQVWNFINFANSGQKVYPWKNTKFENIRYGWHSIIELSKSQPDFFVENLKLDNGHQFKDYVRMFKATIEFRTDLNDDDRFSELFWNSITSGLPKDFEVTFNANFDEIGYDLNVYCDVIGMLEAMNTICNWIVRHKAKSSVVNVNLISEDNYYILEIFHIGSFFNNREKLKNPSGDFDSLRKRLFSVCDFSMEGDFLKNGQRQGSLIVSALNENTKMKNKVLTDCDIDESDKEIGGIKYKLKIYKR